MLPEKLILLGYFVGEGSCGIYFCPHRRTQYGFSIRFKAEVQSTDWHFLEAYKKFYGGYIMAHQKPHVKRWQISSKNDLEIFMKDLTDIKIETQKREQAKLMLKGINFHRKGQYYSKEDIIKLAHLRQEIQKLNKQGKNLIVWTVDKIRAQLKEFEDKPCLRLLWTQEETALLKKQYPIKSLPVLRILFPNRSKYSIQGKAYCMGLKKAYARTCLARSVSSQKTLDTA